MGNGDSLGGCGGSGLVFKADGIGKGRCGGNPLFLTKAFGSDDVVGVTGADDAGDCVKETVKVRSVIITVIIIDFSSDFVAYLKRYSNLPRKK